jgi:glucokinase
MYLGIEIGGTKLQVGVGAGDGSPFAALERQSVDPRQGAAGILRQIESMALPLAARYAVRRAGVGFGGPVDDRRGMVLKSHHVEGWDGFNLNEWCAAALGLSMTLANDCDAACFAESRFGAGKGADPVLYVTVGTGIGGGLVVGGKVYPGSGKGAVEIGHLRPGPSADLPDMCLEAYAAGWGIAAAAQSRMIEPLAHRLARISTEGDRSPDAIRRRLVEQEDFEEESVADLRVRCDGSPENLTARQVAQAAAEGNALAQEILDRACQTLGWGVAQAITLLSPQVVVIGGGVSLVGEQLFFAPVRKAIEQYVFPPFLGTYRVVPAALREAVVVHGALALAATAPDPY